MGMLNGKTVLITGALGTIGQSMVARFMEEGARVIASDRADAATVPTGVTYVGMDLNNLAALEAGASGLVRSHGAIDVLVNNAATVINQPYENVSIERYEEEVRVNSSAAFILSRVCAEGMKARGAGRIINLTSATLTGHWEGFAPYVASKGAMLGLVKALSRELGHHGITVNGISPGAVVSEAEWRHFGDKREEYHQWILQRQSLKRRIEPVDIANLAVFLASPMADLITGQNINCDGGW